MTSDARARPQEEDAVASESTPEETAPAASEESAATDTEATGSVASPDTGGDTAQRDGRRSRRAARRRDDEGTAGGTPTGSRPSLPLVPVLAVLLVLLLAAVGFLWFTRPGTSSVHTADYVEALQAARSGVVDMTSFDYLTLDDDLVKIKRVTTGDLQKEATSQLDSRRKQITDTQATVNTEVVGAGVTTADASKATVLLVIQSTQKSKASQQAQVLRYRIRVDMEKKSGRWLLSGIAGTGTGANG